ncbi:hypothetical protein JKF63_05108 [Porcisia hertigi]|uniref:Uncharacterized protein n=1 Tax=Porcisia hertigi TaxID=2761500 RepID=A0A836IHQ8_9TRYP|nr:hypothetical protein JKF63_05108 [Porcisia hertigi]
MASDAALSAMNTGSGGKAIVDAPPRLEFHRQSSARTYIRSNTVTSAPVYTADAGLPPAGAAATATAAGSSASPSADVKSSEAALKGSDRDAAGAAGRSPTGASAASVPHTIRRNAAQMLSTKPNLSRRTARSASGLPVGNNFVRTSANRRLPTVATVPTESSSSSTPLTKRTR